MEAPPRRPKRRPANRRTKVIDACRRSHRGRSVFDRIALLALVILAALCSVPWVPTPSALAQDPPPEGEATIETPAPTPTGTRRPTRTPRATMTPTATPLPAGALRLVLALDPASPGDVAAPISVGEPFRASVRLFNVDSLPALDLMLEIVLPAALLADDVRAARGEITRDEDVVRWYLPALEPASEVTLKVVGVAGSEAGGLRGQPLCVLLLSRAAPIEHCLEIRVAPQQTLPGAPAASGEIDFLALPTAETGVGLSDVLAETPRVLAGWGLLALGLGVLGLWAGVSMRGRDAA